MDGIFQWTLIIVDVNGGNELALLKIDNSRATMYQVNGVHLYYGKDVNAIPLS